MKLTPKQKSYLRGKAHSLKPVIIIGNNGLSEAVLNEIEIALAHHELLKVKIGAGERIARQAIIDEICKTLGAEFVQTLGRIATIYRPAEKPVIVFPK